VEKIFPIRMKLVLKNIIHALLFPAGSGGN
jgi:hypothetical protein